MTPKQFARHLADPSLPEYARALDRDCPLDRWISYAVKVLRDAGIETYESCQGGPGHSYQEPAVRFGGGRGEGFRAVAVALTYGLPVFMLRRFWRMEDGELHGPAWEITFHPLARLIAVQKVAERSGLLRGPQITVPVFQL